MRPIDADALTEFLKCLLPERGMWEIEGDTGKNAVCETVAEAIEMVKNMETIQPEKAQLSCEGTTSDMISRQAAIDVIEDYPHGNAWNVESTEEMVDEIKTLPPAQPEPKWIPVGEKLPETEDFVLASLSGKYRNTTFEHACEIADYVDGEWCIHAYPNMSAEKCAELIEAWMSLPEPYQKGAIK